MAQNLPLRVAEKRESYLFFKGKRQAVSTYINKQVVQLSGQNYKNERRFIERSFFISVN